MSGGGLQTVTLCTLLLTGCATFNSLPASLDLLAAQNIYGQIQGGDLGRYSIALILWLFRTVCCQDLYRSDVNTHDPWKTVAAVELITLPGGHPNSSTEGHLKIPHLIEV